ncbi:MAG: GHKL domain-containing protein [Sphingobacteriales bacterium]|nr:MAG: GHKL domain-containing protein [Sphingobacteriales bacterium]
MNKSPDLKQQVAVLKREITIEDSLEKVRSIAMAMKQPGDMLKICKTISQQLQKLGIREIRNVQTAIIYPHKGTYLNYEFYAKHNKLLATEVLYINHPMSKAFVKQMLSGPNGFFKRSLTEKKVKDWYWFQQKSTNQFADKYLLKASSLNYYWYSLGPVALGISTYEPLNKEEQDLFIRFRNVFELAYKRFLDIEKAEAQAREAQIQLALEKVRARTMAMQKSEELAETAFVLLEQFKQLGSIPDQVTIGLIKEATKEIEFWITIDGKKVNTGIIASAKKSPVINTIYQGWQQQDTTKVVDLSGSLLKNYLQYRYQISKDQGLNVKQTYDIKRRVIHIAYFSKGFLTFSSDEQQDSNTLELLSRFAGVFEGTYTRFLDLQKAEAQAKEAQIEAALEKVRSTSLAMHQSDELENVVVALFDKLLDLGISFHGAFIFLFEKEKRNIQLWVASKVNPPVKVDLPHETVIEHNIIIQDLWLAKEKGKDIINKAYSGKVKNDYFRYVGRYNASNVPEPIRQMMLKAKSWTVSYAAEKNAVLGIDSWTGHLTTEEDFKIIKRFARVFEQAYARFLDLQKAEAQAREAQIEAALEKVRSRSLAMHTSQELTDVVLELRKQMGILGQKDLDTCVIHLNDISPDYVHSWAAIRPPGSYDGFVDSSVVVPKKGLLIIEEALKAYKAGKKEYVIINENKKLSQWLNFLQKKSPQAYQKIIESSEKNRERSFWSFADFPGGSLLIVTLESPEKSSRDLLRKFANVFGLAYQRFADLKKAEAQAREAQIETSMEKVRSRSLAMQKPGELIEVAELLRQEMGRLGVEELETSSIYIVGEKDTAECWYAIKDVRDKHTKLVSDEMTLQLKETRVGRQMWKFYQSGNTQTSILMKGDSRKEWINYCAERSKVLKGYYGEEIPERTYHLVKFSGGYMGAASPGEISIESWGLLKRAAAVFSLAYTRFKDLQEAAAREREAQIELALERIRSRSMAMHKSDELKEVIQLVLEQFIHLKINAEHAGFYIDYKVHNDMHIWLADPNIEPFFAIIPYFDTPTWNSFLEAKAKGITLHTDLLDFKEKNKFYKSLFKLFTIPEEAKKFYLQCKGLAVSTVLLESVGLYIENFSAIPYTDEENEILIRFGKVFQQTYTRFLDLQKAEAQAKEAQIEAALERIRSRTMGMQRSEELNDVAAILFKQVSELGIKAWTTGFNVWSDDNNFYTDYITSPQGNIIKAYTIDTSTFPVFKEISDAKKSGNEFLVQYLEGEQLQETYRRLTNFGGEKQYEKMLEDGFQFPSHQYDHFVFGSKVSLMFITYEPLPEAHDIFKRFGKVFEQTYTRFLDLQKAEAQARESQIQLALERVRARTMAMQHSNELQDAANLLFKQVKTLGIPVWSCGYNIWEKDEKICTGWMSTEDAIQPPFKIPLTESPTFIRFYQSRQKNEGFYTETVEGAALVAHYDYMFSLPDFKKIGNQHLKSGLILPESQINHVANFAQGNLIFITHDPVPEAHNIFIRFAKVFEQTYTRFIDLQKAESQAREGQIQLALERVRARTMAMQKSDELPETSFLLFQQMKELGETAVQNSIAILKEEEGFVELSTTVQGNTEPGTLQVPMNDPHVMAKAVAALKEKRKSLIVEISGKELKEYNELRNSFLKTKVNFPEDKWIVNIVFFSKGWLSFSSNHKISNESFLLLERFAAVFEQTYTRFLDLKKAEAQAREAQIEAALEKVRSRTLAMQKSDELAETSAELFRQLINLGIAPNRLYINIIKDDNGNAEFWITDEDGSKVSMAYEDNMYHNPTFKKMFEGWKAQRKSLIIDMHNEELNEYFRYLTSIHVPFKGGLQQKRRVQHLAYFSKGFIGMASPDEQPKETLELLERFAYVFNLTFARFNDLKIAEAHALQAEEDLQKLITEKRRTEEALTELKATQQQLIQSEKMASLGELTAGIAHEIQNPLNFVNNFSEVSAELIDEMNEEMNKGNMDDAREIANDLKQNLEKINHHGKRAGDIVKGMLLHSRSSSGVKESTNINALADEYLRLAYHGLRAKDKTFNATMKTDFDETIGSINIIPQDIGRVILNLITNAFYVVNEKAHQNITAYEPTVTVSTKKDGDKVLISVSDNGNGIPQKILDKIFQPFFTTKPTGQGTGLGLSLSYDIVKAHGGELKVETKEGEGSIFTIQLPIIYT